jgi:hypothetical protein
MSWTAKIVESEGMRPDAVEAASNEVLPQSDAPMQPMQPQDPLKMIHAMVDNLVLLLDRKDVAEGRMVIKSARTLISMGVTVARAQQNLQLLETIKKEESLVDSVEEAFNELEG